MKKPLVIALGIGKKPSGPRGPMPPMIGAKPKSAPAKKDAYAGSMDMVGGDCFNCPSCGAKIKTTVDDAPMSDDLDEDAA